MIPKVIQRLDQPMQMTRLDRWRDFQEVSYPLSALELSEMTEIPVNTITNYRGGQIIPNYMYSLITKLKVRQFINDEIVTRTKSNGAMYNISIRKIVIKRLQKASREINTEKASKAIAMLNKLGVS